MVYTLTADLEIAPLGNGTCKLPPVIVVGCGHSGTSIFIHILGTHPWIHAIAGETYFLSRPIGVNWSEIVRRNGLFSRYCLTAKKELWAEKSPVHIYFLEKYFKLNPNGKVIILYRDGRDVAISIANRLCTAEEEGIFDCANNNESRMKAIVYGAERWKNDNLEGLKYLGNSRVKFIQYELLARNPFLVLHEVCSFLEIPYLPNIMLNFYKRPPHWKINGYIQRRRFHQINTPLTDLSSSWVTNMTLRERETFSRITGDLLTRFGYTRADSTWQNWGAS